MSRLGSQLAWLVAIDEEVIRARKGKRDTDPDLLALVEKLLPGTTGFGQAGWSRELLQLFNRDGVRRAGVERVQFPTLQETIPDVRPAFAGLSGPPSKQDDSDQHVYRDPALARAAYATVVLEKISRLTPDAPSLAAYRDVRSTAVDAFTGFATAGGATDIDIDLINDWDSWATRVGDASAQGSQPCSGWLQRVDGQYVSTVTTDSKESNLGVQDVENIIDPMNWGVCSPFFDQMQQNAPKRNTKRWSRVKERVTAEPTEYCLETDLIFWKERRDGGIFINYDIDPERQDPGLVEVDNGYIWITPLPPADPKSPGVRIRTSKQERINGLSPCATAALACKMGWADMGRAMLADTARKNVNGTLVDKNGNPAQLKKFYTSCEEDPEEKG